MFGWFRPTCPCDPEAKRWVEERLRWLARQFGLHILLERPIVVPTPEFFPDKYDATPNAARRLFARVCESMHVDSSDIKLVFFNDPTPGAFHQLDPSLGFAAGTWSSGDDEEEEESFAPKIRWKGESSVIRIERGALDRPADIIGTMAHELSHEKLLGGAACRPDGGLSRVRHLPREQPAQVDRIVAPLAGDETAAARVHLGADARLCDGTYRLVSGRGLARMGPASQLGTARRVQAGAALPAEDRRFHLQAGAAPARRR